MVVGSLIIGLLVASAVTIFFLDRVTALFRRTYTVVAVFPQAPGMRAGTPVWVAGVQVGQISDIALLPPGDSLARVALAMELNRSTRPQLRRDSRLRFTSARMVGEQVVELSPGSAASPELSDGDTIRVTLSPGAEAVVARAREVHLAVDSLMLEAVGLRAQFTARQGQLRQVMREAAMARRELAELQRTFAGGQLSRLMSIQAAGGPLDRVQARVSEIQRLVGQTQERVAATRREAAPAQRDLMANAKQVQADIAALRSLMNDSAGTLPRLQRDSALQRGLAGVRARLDSLVTESRKHPWRYFF